MNVNRAWTICAFAVLGFVTPACTSAKYKDIEVEAQSNPKANFAGYKTYAWAAAAATIRDPEMEWSVPDMDVGAEIRHLIGRELRSRGMTEVNDSPDVLMLYGIGIDMKALDVVVDKETEARTLEEIPRGGLMVVLADPVSRQVIWVGGATAKLSDNPSMELVKERLDYAVTQMFKEMPK